MKLLFGEVGWWTSLGPRLSWTSGRVVSAVAMREALIWPKVEVLMWVPDEDLSRPLRGRVICLRFMTSEI